MQARQGVISRDLELAPDRRPNFRERQAELKDLFNRRIIESSRTSLLNESRMSVILRYTLKRGCSRGPLSHTARKTRLNCACSGIDTGSNERR